MNNSNKILTAISVILLLTICVEFYYLKSNLFNKGQVANQAPTQITVVPYPSIIKTDPFEGRFSSEAAKLFEDLLKTPSFEYIKHFGTNPKQQRGFY